MEKSGNTPEKKGRPTIYSGAGYVPGQRTAPRRSISSENQSDRGTDRRGVSAQRKSVPENQKRTGRRSTAAENTGLQEKLKQRRRKKLRRILCCMGALLGVAYIGAAVYFSFHFYSDTFLYGIDCSRKTVFEVKSEVKTKLSNYVLEVRERENKTETISASQIDLAYVDNGGIDRMLKAQRAYIWPVMMLLEQEPADSVSFSYDESLALARLNELECMDSVRAVAPRDAYIGATDTGYEVVKEVMGTTLDQKKTQEAVLRALDSGATAVSLEEEGCYVNPEIYQDNEELQSDAAAMSELAQANITYTFGSETEIVDAARIRDWIVRLADGSFVIDDMRVTDYVESLAAKYDTFGLPLEFYTSIGTTVTLSGGDYGWCIDQDAMVVALLNALAEGYRGEMEPVYLYSAMSHENQGIGYTYVEICISRQEMWCYQDGNLIVDTPVVTGNPNKGNATPSGGVWAIDAKKRNAILTGEGYTAPVDYWMPFNGDVGIHDMQQRAYFGGSIYLSNGSHGCINTPYDQVQIIYDAVSVGTPVIVYE